uniref:Uncharacterized protein n=1 Tax=Klebsiella pneumoniae TaxID=573 RepID=A0A8B0SNS4_KLEPN|nr:hypothetical protein [Klebsiella pneumoniae]
MSGNTEICQIPAGETECTGAVSWSIPKSGNGITTYFFRLTDMDKNTFISHCRKKDITGTLICYPR